MPTPILMPRFGMAQVDATVGRWLRQPGDAVKQGDPVVEVETDKTTMEVEAPASGVLTDIQATEGQVVAVTAIIGYILAPGETSSADVSAPPAASPAFPPARVTPLARRVAAEIGVDLDGILPTTPGTRITRADVERHVALSSSPVAGAAGVVGKEVSDKPRATPAARRSAREHNIGLAGITGSGPRGRVQARDVAAAAARAHAAPASTGVEGLPEGVRIVALQGIRRTVAHRVQASYQTVPHITLTVEADMAAALALQDEFPGGPRISVTALLIKVCAWALMRHPWVNASLRDAGSAGEAIYLYPSANVGIAVALEEGVIVPVVHQAEKLGLSEIALRLEDLTSRARQGRLTPDDVHGGTFTISNLGIYGIEHFAAIINTPEAAILAVGKISKRPHVIERAQGDGIEIRPLMSLTLSADHRIVDGAAAARFLADVVQTLEQPARMLA